MNNRTFAILLLLFFNAGISSASGLEASLRYKIQFEKHHSAPTDVIVETDGSTGIYEAFSGSYLTYNHNGKAVGSTRKDFLKGGNCFVKYGNDFLFCNSANASLDMLSHNLEKRESFSLPSDMKGKYDPTDALVADGFIYSVDNDNHRIIKTDPGTKSISLTVGGYGRAGLSFYYPYSIAADLESVLYVSEVMNTRVQKITKGFKFYEYIGKWGVKGGELYRPTGIALHKGKTLLVADGYLGIIQCFNTAGKFTGLVVDTSGKKLELGSITHLRVNGNILAAVDAFNKTVYIYTIKEQ